jgi:hypothetical protein
MMLGVVPLKQITAKRVSVLERLESAWKLRAILESSELRFGERIVVGNVGPRGESWSLPSQPATQPTPRTSSTDHGLSEESVDQV